MYSYEYNYNRIAGYLQGTKFSRIAQLIHVEVHLTTKLQ